MKDQVLALINDERRRQHLPILKADSALASSAQSYAAEMYSRHFFSHIDPMGHTMGDRFRASDFLEEKARCCPDTTCSIVHIGENLATGYRSADAVFDAWMKSPTHRRNILDSRFTETGFGLAAGIWVEHFGGCLACTAP